MNKLIALLEVRKIIALSLTILFIIMALRGQISPENTFTIITTVLAYYFGKSTALDKAS